MRAGISLIALCTALAGCVTPEAGCVTYGLQRATMPPLPDDPLGRWQAVTDSAMTKACRP